MACGFMSQSGFRRGSDHSCCQFQRELLFLVYQGTSIMFSIVAASIYIPTNSAGGFPFLHTPRGSLLSQEMNHKKVPAIESSRGTAFHAERAA